MPPSVVVEQALEKVVEIDVPVLTQTTQENVQVLETETDDDTQEVTTVGDTPVVKLNNDLVQQFAQNYGITPGMSIQT
ncbi:TPA: hypothetical protein QB352_001854 [Pasteurella multocida]|nr:hypothetical protein [Pasteurella multocida]